MKLAAAITEKAGIALGYFNFAELTVLRAAMATDNGLKDKNNPARPAMLENTIMTEKDQKELKKDCKLSPSCYHKQV